MKIGKTDKTEVDPAPVQCVPCGHVWTLAQGMELRCPKCKAAYMRVPPQVSA